VLKCRGAAVENCWKRRRGGDGMQRSCRGAEEVLKRCRRGAKVQRCSGLELLEKGQMFRGSAEVQRRT